MQPAVIQNATTCNTPVLLFNWKTLDPTWTDFVPFIALQNPFILNKVLGIFSSILHITQDIYIGQNSEGKSLFRHIWF